MVAAIQGLFVSYIFNILMNSVTVVISLITFAKVVVFQIPTKNLGTFFRKKGNFPRFFLQVKIFNTILQSLSLQNKGLNGGFLARVYTICYYIYNIYFSSIVYIYYSIYYSIVYIVYYIYCLLLYNIVSLQLLYYCIVVLLYWSCIIVLVYNSSYSYIQLIFARFSYVCNQDTLPPLILLSCAWRRAKRAICGYTTVLHVYTRRAPCIEG